MPNILNFLSGFFDGQPGMKDYAHASRLYVDDNYRLAPKHKFLYHVVFDIDNTIPVRPFTTNEQLEINMLVKQCDLPKYDMGLEERQQYNKKTYIGTRLTYAPVNITFHDDKSDLINALWKAYYEYNFADSQVINPTTPGLTKDDMYDANRVVTQFGMDTANQRKKPLIKNIQIFTLYQHRFTSFTLVNPVIGSFSHDRLDQTDGTGIMSNTMQVFYEAVLYGAGVINRDPDLQAGDTGIPGFATIHYDHEPSPLSVLGGGTTSIFGPGGVVDGVGSVISDVQNGTFDIGTILKGVNTIKNAKQIRAKDAVKEEIKGIVKQGVLDIGKTAGTSSGPVSNFSVGTALAVTAAVNATSATAKGPVDNARSTSTVVTQPSQDTVQFLTANEATQLVSTNETAKSKVASSIYYKEVGSRKGFSIQQSDIEFASSTPTLQSQYKTKAVDTVGTLVTDGYIKIVRQNNSVVINAEKEKI